MIENADSLTVDTNSFERSLTFLLKTRNVMVFGRMAVARMESDVSLDIQISIGRVQLFCWDCRLHVVLIQRSSLRY
jgi:hypothetical protein